MDQTLMAGLRLVITDVDGVLTDGGLYYGEHGEVIKRFHVRDGLGVRLLQQIGVLVAVVSGRGSPALTKRLVDLGITHSRTSVGDKGQAVKEIMAEVGATPGETIFLGDDLIDMLGFTGCGMSAAVADAPSYVRDAVTLVLDTAGGQGAFRELADRILTAKGHGEIFRSGGVFEPADGGSRQ